MEPLTHINLDRDTVVLVAIAVVALLFAYLASDFRHNRKNRNRPPHDGAL